MTIQRQYSLPNCTLILEGLSDGSAAGGGQIDTRPLMTILVNAECRFTGQTQALSGGRDFLESLVRAVSRYAQEFLSQVRHPKLHEEKPSLVQLEKVEEKNLHRLTLLPTDEASGNRMVSDSVSHTGVQQGKLIQLDLTTVQLFDLVEAIDQFLADRRTLPELNVLLQPLSKRYRKADQPMAKRAAPATLGMASLAFAAIALFFVPIPEIRSPKPVAAEPNSSETTSPSPGEPLSSASPSPTSSPPSATDLEDVLTTVPEITDPTQLRFLQRNLYTKLDQSWENRDEVDENLEYRVGVGKDGEIIGYKPVDEQPSDAAQDTPLPELLYTPTNGSVASQDPIAQFRVVFNRRGILQISPWRGYTGKPSLGPEITDASVVTELNDKLYEQLTEKWEGTPLSRRDLVYRVAVTEEGVIADYEPNNQPASDYIRETPLPDLHKPEAAGIGGADSELLPQKPLAQFRVVFKSGGVLEVSPLRGYR